MKPLQLKGRKFGKLSVLNRVKSPKGDKAKCTYWMCRCECGKEKVLSAVSLRNGTKSCGCVRVEAASRRANDVAERRFGRLTAKRIDGRSRHGNRWWCECDCGNTTTVRVGHLLSGAIVSCGCAYEDYWKTLVREGSCHKAIWRRYRQYSKTKRRAFDLTNDDFTKLILSPCVYCGAEMSNTYTYKGVKVSYNGIDRIDNTLGYQPGNCVSCCVWCNRAKGARTYHEFVEWLQRTHSLLESRNWRSPALDL